MDEKNKVLEALGKLPELVDSVNAIIDESEKKDAFLAKMAETKVEAQMSEAGMHEIVDAVTEAIKATPCGVPDVSQTSQLFADAICENVKELVGEAVKEKVSNTAIKLEKHHYHTMTWDLSSYADKKTRQRFRILLILCLGLIGLVTCGIYLYLNCDIYWGEQYKEIYESEYTTDAERVALENDLFLTGYLPKEYKKNPKLVKEKIRRNQEIIRHRKMEDANKNGGKATVKTPLEL